MGEPAPALDGVHHLKLPVRDLERSCAWYVSRLGHVRRQEWFEDGVPDKDAVDALAARLTDLGETHAGVHLATVGWILPPVHDPDGHEVGFHTTGKHTDAASVPTVHDPRETSERRERETTG